MQFAAFMRKLVHDDRGATLVEYGLMVALIALGLVTMLQTIGTSTSDTLSTAARTIKTGN